MIEGQDRPPLLARLHEYWRRVKDRKLVAWMGGYAIGAWAVFQVVLGIPDVWPGVPIGLLQTVNILLLIGFPVAFVLAWYHGEKGRQEISSVEVVLLLLIGASGVALMYRADLVPFLDPYRVDQPRQSYLVDPHELASTTADEEILAIDAATALRNFLTGWREIRAPSPILTAGVSMSLGLAGALRADLEESIQRAREVRVGTVAAVTAEILGDDAEVQVTLFDVRSRRQIGETITNRGPKTDTEGLVLPIAQEILGLANAPPSVLLRRESESVVAMQQTFEGFRLLGEWELEAAARAYRGALEADSTLARAHRDLGLTVYWQTARDPDRRDELRPDIVWHSVAAIRHSQRLPYRDSLHAVAFNALAAERFGEARTRYRDLVATDSADVFAWLMQGTVEFLDRATVATASGSAQTRASLSLAAQSFLTASQLGPGIALGYGHLFDLYRGLGDGARGCFPYVGFRPPDAPEDLGYEEARPETLLFFCAAAPDSLRWISPTEVSELAPAALARGANDYLQRAWAQIEDWARFARNSPRPLEERSAWLLERRRRVYGTAEMRIADSLGAEAARVAMQALALTTDTTPELLIRAGNLHLLGGDDSTAVSLVERGLTALQARDGQDHDLPDAAINVYLATGRIVSAETLAIQAGAGVRMYPDPEGDDLIRVAVDEELLRLELYGAVGLAESVAPALGRIEERWDVERYDERVRRLLRRGVLNVLGPALVLDRTAGEGWLEGLDDLPDSWQAWLATGPDAADVFARALTDHRAAGPSMTRAYVLAHAAARLGLDSDAADLFQEVMDLPYGVERLNAGWGLRRVALLGRARALEALGDPAAEAAYAEFALRWREADAPLRGLVASADSALARLRQ